MEAQGTENKETFKNFSGHLYDMRATLEQSSKNFLCASEKNNEEQPNQENAADLGSESAAKRRGRQRKIYDKDDSPEIIKEKRKKRAVELKLNKLKWTLGNQQINVSGKRQKKAPQRFELSPVNKRKSCMDNYQGSGEQLGNIPWIYQHLMSSNLYTLRLLHRTIFRKQGMFSDKHIRKSVIKFSGFPFDGTHDEIRKRRDQLEKANIAHLSNLCDMLAVRRASKDVMIDRIISFLLCPNQKSVNKYMHEAMVEKFQHPSNSSKMNLESGNGTKKNTESFIKDFSHTGKYNKGGVWKKPTYFSEGNGVKLKYIRSLASNIHLASDSFLELLHRLLYLNAEEPQKMRQNILEFSGLNSEAANVTNIYRIRILSLLPAEQLKLICRVLCLSTWHRSRQHLSDGIMDFLAAPRISLMKKRVPPHFTEEISFSFDNFKASKVIIPESEEMEEIEIVPDIILPDDGTSIIDNDSVAENEYLGVKLKNFSNIHYQVISTPAAKLQDVHMILYLNTTSQTNIRRNVLEFAGFPFDHNSKEYVCRQNLMEQMSLEDLKAVATVFCVSQYLVDESKNGLIDAILKFLLKPSALLNSSTIMPTISPAPIVVLNKNQIVKKKATSTSITPQLTEMFPEIVISEVKTLKEEITATVSSPSTSTTEDLKRFIPEHLKASFLNDNEIMPLPTSTIKKESLEIKRTPTGGTELSSKVKKTGRISHSHPPIIDTPA